MDGRIPRSVIRRFPRYLWRIQELREAGECWVSSQALAEALGVTSSTVRQDLSHVDFRGVAKRGYELERLEAVLAQFLGVGIDRVVVIVGAGNLGMSLARHQRFARRGFHVVGIFDTDPRVVGRRVGELTVSAMAALSQTVRKRKVELGMIAVPPAAAQAVADQLVRAGVKGLLNLAPTHVTAPPAIPVVDARIAASLLELSCAVKIRESGTPRRRARGAG